MLATILSIGVGIIDGLVLACTILIAFSFSARLLGLRFLGLRLHAEKNPGVALLSLFDAGWQLLTGLTLLPILATAAGLIIINILLVTFASPVLTSPVLVWTGIWLGIKVGAALVPASVIAAWILLMVGLLSVGSQESENQASGDLPETQTLLEQQLETLLDHTVEDDTNAESTKTQKELGTILESASAGQLSSQQTSREDTPIVDPKNVFEESHTKFRALRYEIVLPDSVPEQGTPSADITSSRQQSRSEQVQSAPSAEQAIGRGGRSQGETVDNSSKDSAMSNLGTSALAPPEIPLHYLNLPIPKSLCLDERCAGTTYRPASGQVLVNQDSYLVTTKKGGSFLVPMVVLTRMFALCTPDRPKSTPKSADGCLLLKQPGTEEYSACVIEETLYLGFKNGPFLVSPGDILLRNSDDPDGYTAYPIADFLQDGHILVPEDVALK